ncbi:MAG: type IV pilus modification protein PilV [Pseudomonadota bacterium]|nr:type IV pilus modification protein PilV [Pseudomonadota bacterium]HJO35633.1 type IV pilus modification protein PilV [Gammaproteobacteria bacterium]
MSIRPRAPFVRLSPSGRARAGAGGFSLIEVLVSVLVLSVALLGMASLQLFGLRFQQSAYLRSQASMAAYDILDRIRANPQGMAAGNYDTVDTDSAPADPNCKRSAGGCTPAQRAQTDIAEWALVVTMLPGGNGTVGRTGDDFTVQIDWTDLGPDGAENQRLTVEAQLQ